MIPLPCVFRTPKRPLDPPLESVNAVNTVKCSASPQFTNRKNAHNYMYDVVIKRSSQFDTDNKRHMTIGLPVRFTTLNCVTVACYNEPIRTPFFYYSLYGDSSCTSHKGLMLISSLRDYSTGCRSFYHAAATPYTDAA